MPKMIKKRRILTRYKSNEFQPHQSKNFRSSKLKKTNKKKQRNPTGYKSNKFQAHWPGIFTPCRNRKKKGFCPAINFMNPNLTDEKISHFQSLKKGRILTRYLSRQFLANWSKILHIKIDKK